MQRTLTALLVQLSIFCALQAQQPSQPAFKSNPRPSLLRVLANPQNFDGQEIQVIGFLSIAFENTALFFHQEDLKFNIFGNAIWIDGTEEMQQNKSFLNRKYVLIRGTFLASEHGHMGLYSGTLTNITRCSQLADPKHPLWGGPPPPAPQKRTGPK